MDTTGPRKCVLIREVSLFQRFTVLPSDSILYMYATYNTYNVHKFVLKQNLVVMINCCVRTCIVSQAPLDLYRQTSCRHSSSSLGEQ